MAKKTSSVHLEESTWSIIDDFKNKFNLSSRNDALERIIFKFNIIENEGININITVDGSITQNKNKAKVIDKSDEDIYNKVSDDAFADMED